MSLNPKMIVPEDRRCGYVTVGLLVSSFIAYAVVTVHQAYEARANPPVQISTVTETFTQPSWTICPAEGIEWSPADSTIVCQYQSSDDDDGLQFERCEHAIVPASVTPMRQRCVTFHTENEVELEKRQDELIFGVNFNVSFDFSNSQGNGVPTRVLLYAHDGLWKPDAPPVRVPFSASSYVKISKSVSSYLESETEIAYDLKVTSAEIEGFVPSPSTGTETVEVHVTLDSFKVTYKTETDPLSVLELFGVISGTFSLVTFLLSIVFTELDDSPQFKARWRKQQAEKEAAEAKKAADAKNGAEKRAYCSPIGTKPGDGAVAHERLRSPPPPPDSPHEVEMGDLEAGGSTAGRRSNSRNRVVPANE